MKTLCVMTHFGVDLCTRNHHHLPLEHCRFSTHCFARVFVSLKTLARDARQGLVNQFANSSVGTHRGPLTKQLFLLRKLQLRQEFLPKTKNREPVGILSRILDDDQRHVFFFDCSQWHLTHLESGLNVECRTVQQWGQSSQ